MTGLLSNLQFAGISLWPIYLLHPSIEGTQAPKFLPVWEPSVALLQPIESPIMSESPLSGCVGQRQKFGQNHHLTFIGSIRSMGPPVPANLKSNDQRLDTYIAANLLDLKTV
jgi:hypothetical protein